MWTEAMVRYLKCVEAGRCVRCHGKHADSGVHCADCRAKNRTRIREARAAKKATR